MTLTGVLSTDRHLEELLRAAGLKPMRISASQLTGDAQLEQPDVLVVDVRGHHQLPQELMPYQRQHPTVGVVLVASSLEPGLMLEAMRAGVKECLVEPLTAQALEETVSRIVVDAAPDAVGQLFAFVGAKGGVGTTTLAVNTAAALRRVGHGEVLLVDLHLGQGDAAVFLGVEPRFSVVDALENVHRLDESFARGVVEKTKAGVSLLASSDRIGEKPVDPQRVRALLEFALRRYRYTVLDVPRSDSALLDGLELASAIVIVGAQELTALRSAARLAHALRQRYGPSRVKIVVNRFDGRADIAQTDAEQAVGDAVSAIPSDYRIAVEAMNTGQPVVLEKHTRLGQAFTALARNLAGLVKPAAVRPAGVLGRLAWRRA